MIGAAPSAIGAQHVHVLWLQMFCRDHPRTRRAVALIQGASLAIKVRAAKRGLHDGIRAAGLVLAVAQASRTEGRALAPCLALRAVTMRRQS